MDQETLDIVERAYRYVGKMRRKIRDYADMFSDGAVEFDEDYEEGGELYYKLRRLLETSDGE